MDGAKGMVNALCLRWRSLHQIRASEYTAYPGADMPSSGLIDLQVSRAEAAIRFGLEYLPIEVSNGICCHENESLGFKTTASFHF